jgi:putative tryptophan/tyrosine transport system substrate-binding protein
LASLGRESYAHRRLLGRLAQQYDLKAGNRRMAAQTVEILNGSNPAEMPYFLEAHWELVINLKAAKELGFEIPAALIAHADRVIE